MVQRLTRDSGHMPGVPFWHMAVGQNCDTPWLTTEHAQNRLLGRSTYRGLRGPGFDPQSYLLTLSSRLLIYSMVAILQLRKGFGCQLPLK